MPGSRIRFASDEDLLRREPLLERSFPRFDRDGNRKNNWDTQHQLAMDQIERKLRARKQYGDRFELGRVGLRSRESLRDCATCYALHYLFIANDTMGDQTGWHARKATYYLRLAEELFESEIAQVDYDFDASGDIDASEQNRPIPTNFIRG